MRLTASAKL